MKLDLSNEDRDQATADEIEEAKTLYALPDECEIDDDAKVSIDTEKNGVWVAGWLFLMNDE